MRTQAERDEQTLDIVFLMGGAALFLLGLAIVAFIGSRVLGPSPLPLGYPVLVPAYFLVVGVILVRRRRGR